MNITVFQADKGDCLLITSTDGKKRVLVDGGMAKAYTDHVSSHLEDLRKAGKKLDVVYVSHIDDDHISGVLQMMDDVAAWRVFDHQKKTHHPNPKQPQSHRPPDVDTIFHNAFHETVNDNSGAIENLLAATATILSGSDVAAHLEISRDNRNLAEGVASAIRLSRRIRPGQLNIKLNPQFAGKLMMVRKTNMPAPIKIGAMTFFVLAPREADLDKLRSDWNQWLKDNQDAVKKLQSDAEKQEEAFTNAEVGAVLQPMLEQAKTLGNRAGITPPNLASLMFLLEEGSRSVLLTGDGFAGDVLEGLKFHNKLSNSGGIHVDVLKVQHHGANNNMTKDFAKAVTADHYVFCGNGFADNPEELVLQTLANSRIGPPAERSPNPQAGNKFKFWFNSSSSVSEKFPDHMKLVEKLVTKLKNESGGKMSAEFIKGDKLELAI